MHIVYINCIVNIFIYFTDEDHKIAKNILRLVKVRMQPFSVYGVFTVDARLPLKFLALTTTYIVVLLQFAFL